MKARKVAICFLRLKENLVRNKLCATGYEHGIEEEKNDENWGKEGRKE